MSAARLVLMVLMTLLAIPGDAQTAPDPAAQPFQWDTKCEQRGCMLFLDVLHGAAGQKNEPDPKDAHQYISLMVGVDRESRKPAILSLHFPPDAEMSQGFFVAFADDKQTNGQWDIKPAAGSMEHLGFDGCDKDSCVARMREGKVDDGNGGLTDLVGEFLRHDHLWLLYTRKGEPIRTMIPLGPYKRAYQRVIDVELTPQK